MDNVQKPLPDDEAASKSMLDLVTQNQQAETAHDSATRPENIATGGAGGYAESHLDAIKRDAMNRKGHAAWLGLEDCGFVPHAGRVLVRRDAAAPPPTDGIVMPGTDNEAPQKGVILAIAVDLYRTFDASTCQALAAPAVSYIAPGARVAFGKYAGAEVEVRGEKLLVMKDEEILGVFTD